MGMGMARESRNGSDRQIFSLADFFGEDSEGTRPHSIALLARLRVDPVKK